MSQEHRIIHTDGDFFQTQNYVLQILSEGKISQPAFILYCFYKSTGGFSQINYSYEYISINSGISKGSITKGIKQLEKAGLIEVLRYGPNKTFDIKLVPGSNLPRRILKQIRRKGQVDNDPTNNFIAQELHGDKLLRGNKSELRGNKPELPTQSMKDDVVKKYNKSKEFDVSTLSKEALNFYEVFTTMWKKRAKTKYYSKDDMYQLANITDFEEATKLIPVFWILDEVNSWVKNSDHTLSAFVHVLKLGALQAHYPKTSFYIQDLQNRV